MTAAGALARLTLILIVAAALPCRAEDVISGRWEGAARIPDDELTVVVDLAQENGAWVGSIIIPRLGLKGAHEMGFSFEGRLRNGKLSGAIRQAAMETPLVLVRAK